MNQPPELTPLLNLGLNRYEAGAYVALTRRGRATGAEVARIAGLPRQRIYDVLDGLVGRGLATVEPGRPGGTDRAARRPATSRAGSLAAPARWSLRTGSRGYSSAGALLAAT